MENTIEINVDAILEGQLTPDRVTLLDLMYRLGFLSARAHDRGDWVEAYYWQDKADRIAEVLGGR